jgi:hypothetical protein
MNDEYDHLRESALADQMAERMKTPGWEDEARRAIAGNPIPGDIAYREEAYDGDYSEVPGLVRELGITWDNSPEDRHRFAPHQMLLALYGHYLRHDITQPLDEDDAQEFLVE